MRIVVIGGGPIGSKLVTRLREDGHEAIPASPDTGVDALTGEGLSQALAGADVVIDVSSPPPLEDAAVLEFFATSTRNLLAAEAAAGVGHHVVLSAVGIDRLQDSGYFRAKTAQEKLIEGSAVPYSIVHATQFFEYLPSLAEAATDGGTARFAAVLFQPMAEDDAVQAIGRISAGPPLNGKVEADAVLGGTRYRDWPGRAAAGGDANRHELDRYVRTELILAETSQPEAEAVAVPVEEWLFGPEDGPRYEASLHSLLGAVEVLEERDRPQTEAR